MPNKIAMFFGALVLCGASGIAQEVKGADRWGAWQFLLGEWAAEGAAHLGKARGRFLSNSACKAGF